MENYYGFRTSDFPLCSRENAKLVKYKLENDTQLLICYAVLNIEMLCTSSAWCLTEAGYPQSLTEATHRGPGLFRTVREFGFLY
jgi:hypothetical protein